jgi:hypothetical protein
MSNEMINLINQAKAQAKRDAFFSAIGKNSKTVVRVILVVATVGIVALGVSAYKKSNQEKFSEKLHRALIDQQIGESQKALESLKEITNSSSAPGGVKALAGLRYASTLLEEGKKSEAVEVYQGIASCRSCDDYVRDLSRLLIVRIWMADSEELKKEDLASRIKKFEESSESLKYHIAEQRAFLEMTKGNKEESKKIFEEIEKAAEKHPALKNRAADGIKMLEE